MNRIVSNRYIYVRIAGFIYNNLLCLEKQDKISASLWWYVFFATFF